MGKSIQMNIRVTIGVENMLKAIGEFEGQDKNELVRSWIADKIGEYRKDKCFMRELNAGHLKVEPKETEEE